jgi:uncharacterized protein (DUF1778 family)
MERAAYGKLPYTFGMTSVLKNERLELRLTAEQKRTIEQAATIAGRSITDFSVPVLIDQAMEVIREDRELHVSQETWEALNEILNRTAKAIPELAELLRRPSVFTD